MCAYLEGHGWEVNGFDLREGMDAHTFFSDPSPPGYDLVVHAAYHVGGRKAIDGISMNFARNVALDGAMFDWALRTGQKRVLYFSSSAAYPVAFQGREEAANETVLEETDIDLTAPLLPDASYGWAKLTGERLAADARANGLDVSVVRPASGCSITQDLSYPFPSIAQRVAKRDFPLKIWGPAGQTRDFIHVEDVVAASMAVVESGTVEAVNICTGLGTTMGELAALLWEKMHSSLSGFDPVYDVSAPTGVFYRVLSPVKMLELYRPHYSMEDLVQQAADWHGFTH